MTEKIIPINIWDDFYDDGYVPEGKIQQTYICVEDKDISHDKTKEILELLLGYIQKNLNTEGLEFRMEFYESRKKYPNLIGTDAEKMFFDRWELHVKHLTHKRLYEWMKVLENVDLKVDGIPFVIYSES